MTASSSVMHSRPPTTLSDTPRPLPSECRGEFKSMKPLALQAIGLRMEGLLCVADFPRHRKILLLSLHFACVVASGKSNRKLRFSFHLPTSDSVLDFLLVLLGWDHWQHDSKSRLLPLIGKGWAMWRNQRRRRRIMWIMC